MSASDTIVLKFLEIENGKSKNNIDTVIYVFYDSLNHKFGIRGKRTDLPFMKFEDFSFYVRDVNQVSNFLKFVITDKNYFSMIFKNFKDLPGNSDLITFEYLCLHDKKDRSDEITGYDELNLNNDFDTYAPISGGVLKDLEPIDMSLVDALNIVKNVGNSYFPVVYSRNA